MKKKTSPLYSKKTLAPNKVENLEKEISLADEEKEEIKTSFNKPIYTNSENDKINMEKVSKNLGKFKEEKIILKPEAQDKEEEEKTPTVVIQNIIPKSSNIKGNEEESYCFKEDEIELGTYKLKVKIHYSTSEENPQSYSYFYAPLNKIAGKLIFANWPQEQGNSRIIKFVNKNNVQFVIKRCFIQCLERSINDIMNNQDLSKFLKDSFNDWEIGQLMRIHPTGINVYDFQITLLTKQNLLITELLMSDGGDSLGSAIENKKFSSTYQKLNILKQISSSMNCLEKFKIFYKDLKADNFLIDSSLSKLKIIDFNISNTNYINVSKEFEESNEIKGFTHGYASPELLMNKLQYDNTKIANSYNQYKSDIYSWGILALYLFGAIENKVKLNNLDQYKSNNNVHGTITGLIKNVEFTESQNLKAKIQCLLNYCLKYNPKQRINFKTLDKLWDKIENESITEKTLLVEIFDSFSTNSDSKIEQLTKELIKEKEKNELLIQELEKSKNQLTLFKKVSDDNLKIKVEEIEVNNSPKKIVQENIENIMYKVMNMPQFHNKDIGKMFCRLEEYLNHYKDIYEIYKRTTNQLVCFLRPFLLSNNYETLNSGREYFLQSIIRKFSFDINLKYTSNSKSTGISSNLYKNSPIQLMDISDLKSQSLLKNKCLVESCNFEYYTFSKNEMPNVKPHLCYHQIQRPNDNILFDKIYNKSLFSVRMDKLDLDKEEIIRILSKFQEIDCIKEIDCGNNSLFDDECAYHLFSTIHLRKYLKGIKLDHTNITNHFLLKLIFPLFAEIKEFIYLTFDRYLIAEDLLEKISKELNLEQNNWNLYNERIISTSFYSRTEKDNSKAFDLDDRFASSLQSRSLHMTLPNVDKKQALTEIISSKKDILGHPLKSDINILNQDLKNICLLIRKK